MGQIIIFILIDSASLRELVNWIPVKYRPNQLVKFYLLILERYWLSSCSVGWLSYMPENRYIGAYVWCWYRPLLCWICVSYIFLNDIDIESEDRVANLVWYAFLKYMGCESLGTNTWRYIVYDTNIIFNCERCSITIAISELLLKQIDTEMPDKILFVDIGAKFDE